MREDAGHARLAHFVVAFGVHEEAHRRVEVAGGFADGADVWGVWESLLVMALRGDGGLWGGSYHLLPLGAVEQHRCRRVLVTWFVTETGNTDWVGAGGLIFDCKADKSLL